MAMSERDLDAEIRMLYLSVPDPKTKAQERDVKARLALQENNGD